MPYEPVKPAFSGTSVATLRTKEKLSVLSAYDLELKIALELKEREEAENNPSKVTIQPNHIAYMSAFPLRQFIYDTFSILEPGRQYKNNWHIDAISEVLQAATVGQIKNFVINLPRRGMKSSLICVMWPTWVWTFLPWTRWLFSSFSEKFALRDSENCRKLINSVWYQQRFGEVFHLSQTENSRRKFANTKGGFRACFGVGKGTGDGGDFVMCDDPHQIDQAESDKMVEKTVNWWHSTMYNSVNDPETAVRGIIHQRVSETDLTGDILARELNYQHLCLPMTWEDDHPHANSISKPFKLGKVSSFEKGQDPDLTVGEDKEWVDPRDPAAPAYPNDWYQQWYKKSYASLGLKSTGEGELMWPNRFTPELIKEIVSEIEVYGESAQLQQRPIRRGGNFFNTEHFEVLPFSAIKHDLANMHFCRYWDKAGSQDTGDWTVGMLMARSAKRPFTLYIVDIVRQRIGYYERMQLMKTTAIEDQKSYVEQFADNIQADTDFTIGIEKEGGSSGKDLSTLERDNLLGFPVVIDMPKGNKAFRAKPAKSISEAGRIKVIKAPWNTAFFKELQKFEPDKENRSDDQIDTLSGCVKLLIFGQRQARSSFSGAR